MADLLMLLAAGIFAGLLSSTLGIGGGLIIVPALTIIFSQQQQAAVATSLLTIFLITAVNLIRFQHQRLIDWRIVGYIALFSSIASFTGGLLAVHLSRIALTLIFILFILAVIYKTIQMDKKAITKRKQSSSAFFAFKIGSLSGIISGLTGVGGGAITTPLLLASGKTAHEKVVPISNGIMLFNALFALLAFIIKADIVDLETMRIGYIYMRQSLFLFISALPFAWFGALLQKRIPLHVRRMLLLILLGLICMRMIIKLVQLIV